MPITARHNARNRENGFLSFIFSFLSDSSVWQYNIGIISDIMPAYQALNRLICEGREKQADIFLSACCLILQKPF